MAADAIGDAISGLGIDVPEGTTLMDMADLIANRMIAKTVKSSITLKGGTVAGAQKAVIPLTQSSIAGSAFSKSGNNLHIEHDAAITISASVPVNVGTTGSITYIYLRKNGSTIKTTSLSGIHSGSGHYGTLYINYTGQAKEGDNFDLYYSGDQVGCSTSGSTIIATGTI